MPTVVELNDISQYPPMLLEKDENGLYPYPTMRCGVLPYFRQGDQIIWGCVKSNRVGPMTVAPPAGIQDILVIKDGQRFDLEVGKPFNNLECDFLQKFLGKLFRDQTYQDIIACLIENKFEIYVENPLVTALHETREEHGADLRKMEGRDHFLLNRLVQLPIQSLSGKRGANAQRFWVASLSDVAGIVLNDTKKIENKIRRNFGREFYEQGCWGTLSEFKDALLEARKSSLLPAQTTQQKDLIAGVLEAYEETIELLERIELLIRADFKKSAFPLGFCPFFSRSDLKKEQEIKEILTIKSALKHISFDTWLVLDLDNTVMESVMELGSDQWFTNLVDSAMALFCDQREATRLALLIYSAVQKHVRTKAVEPGIVKVINALQDIGIPVFALTARDIAIKESTIHQLEAIGIDFSRSGMNVSNPSYEKGIIFCNGRNKGKVWQAFVAKCPKLPAHIVMLDDKKRHLNRMLDESKALNFTGLRYGFLDEKISTFNMTKANYQLAFLMEHLPIDVQHAITNLKLVPHDFDPVLTVNSFSSSFFSHRDHGDSLSASHVSLEPYV